MTVSDGLVPKICKCCGRRFRGEPKQLLCSDECRAEMRARSYEKRKRTMKRTKRMVAKEAKKIFRENAKRQKKDVVRSPEEQEAINEKMARLRAMITKEDYEKAAITRADTCKTKRVFEAAVKAIVLAEDIKGNSVLEEMVKALVNKVLDMGDVSAFVALRDTMGEKPIEKKVSASFDMPTFAPPPIKKEDDPEYAEFLEWKRRRGLIEAEYKEVKK